MEAKQNLKTMFDLSKLIQRRNELKLSIANLGVKNDSKYNFGTIGCGDTCVGTCKGTCENSCEGRCTGGGGCSFLS